MSTLFKFFSPKPKRPDPISATPQPTAEKVKKGRKAQLLALKSTGPSGILEQANVSNRFLI